MNPDALAEVSMSWTPYRFAFNNSIFWSDRTGLFENRYDISSGMAQCSTCPNTPEFQPYIDDPNHEYVYDPNKNSVTQIIELEDVVAVGEKGDNIERKVFEIFLDVAESTGVFASNVLNDRFKYGEKYGNKTITIRTKLGPGINTNANSLKNLQKAGKISGKIVKGLVVADIAMSGEIRASHVLTATMISVNAIPVAGNVISGIYFGADLITMGASYLITGEAKGIGDYLDESLDGGVILEAQDVGIDYEGVYK